MERREREKVRDNKSFSDTFHFYSKFKPFERGRDKFFKSNDNQPGGRERARNC